MCDGSHNVPENAILRQEDHCEFGPSWVIEEDAITKPGLH